MAGWEVFVWNGLEIQHGWVMMANQKEYKKVIKNEMLFVHFMRQNRVPIWKPDSF
jgi:hypothetical protein